MHMNATKGRLRYDPKSCIHHSVPQYIDTTCYDCGKAYKTSVRALAEGDDVCKECNPRRRNLKAYTSLVSIPSDLHKAYLDFYYAVWQWITNRTETTSLKMNKTVGIVFYNIDKKHNCEELPLEEAEIKILQTLFSAFINHKLQLTRRSWKQFFYAFWQVENFYRG